MIAAAGNCTADGMKLAAVAWYLQPAVAVAVAESRIVDDDGGGDVAAAGLTGYTQQ